MAFKSNITPPRRLRLHPLMDMFFIMMIFFLIIAADRKPKKGESQPLQYAVPTLATGTSNVLLQMLDDDQVFWLDFGYQGSQGSLNPTSGSAQSHIYSYQSLLSYFTEFANRMRSQGRSDINILIRCPAHRPYQDILRLRTQLSNLVGGLPGVTIGFNAIAGDIDDIYIESSGDQDITSITFENQ